jgi:hypothetical protein
MNTRILKKWSSAGLMGAMLIGAVAGSSSAAAGPRGAMSPKAPDVANLSLNLAAVEDLTGCKGFGRLASGGFGPAASGPWVSGEAPLVVVCSGDLRAEGADDPLGLSESMRAIIDNARQMESLQMRDVLRAQNVHVPEMDFETMDMMTLGWITGQIAEIFAMAAEHAEGPFGFGAYVDFITETHEPSSFWSMGWAERDVNDNGRPDRFEACAPNCDPRDTDGDGTVSAAEREAAENAAATGGITAESEGRYLLTIGADEFIAEMLETLLENVSLYDHLSGPVENVSLYDHLSAPVENVSLYDHLSAPVENLSLYDHFQELGM